MLDSLTMRDKIRAFWKFHGLETLIWVAVSVPFILSAVGGN